MSTILYLTTIEFGLGARKELPRALNELGVRQPLVVSDHGVAAEGLLDEATGAMDAPRFLDVPANPTETAVKAALEAYRAGGCDGIVAVGGGSPIDLAKGVALLATHAGPLENYAAIYGGVARITHGRAGRRHADDGGDRRGGRPRGAAHARRRAQARLHQPAPHSEARNLRPGVDARPSPSPHRRDRARRALALHRDVPLAALQSAGRSHRARWRAPRLGEYPPAFAKGRISMRGAR